MIQSRWKSASMPPRGARPGQRQPSDVREVADTSQAANPRCTAPKETFVSMRIGDFQKQSRAPPREVAIFWQSAPASFCHQDNQRQPLWTQDLAPARLTGFQSRKTRLVSRASRQQLQVSDAFCLEWLQVFQRVGHLSVSLGKLHQSDQSVEAGFCVTCLWTCYQKPQPKHGAVKPLKGRSRGHHFAHHVIVILIMTKALRKLLRVRLSN